MSSITVLTPDWFTHNPGGGGAGPVLPGTHITVAAAADGAGWANTRAEVDALHEAGYRVWWERTRQDGSLLPVPPVDGAEGRTVGDFVYPVLASETV